MFQFLWKQHWILEIGSRVTKLIVEESIFKIPFNVSSHFIVLTFFRSIVNYC